MADIDTDTTLTQAVDRGPRSAVPMTEAESKIRNRLAFAIWFAEQDDKLPDTPEARRAAFDETRVSYTRIATRVMLRLRSDNIAVTALE